ncbi:MAG: ABC transporter substrate-binding protein [Nitrospirae bacterium]|nr:ABC transporter substrate-binding protein [Nitrospirota bacterium]
MVFRTIASITILFILLCNACGCTRSGNDSDRSVVLVFKHGKTAGDAGLFREIIKEFENRNPGIKVKDETLPASTDEQHQFYVINLEGGSSEFDVLSMDVIWVPEFARAGWLKDISNLLPGDEREKYFPGPIQSVSFEGGFYAVPWYIDAGLLYYRKDILEKYKLSPPETWQDLVDISKRITEKETGMYGFIWQGKQYEGLVCNVLEYFQGNGGEVLENSVSALGGWQLGINRYSKNPEAAEKLINYLTSTEIQKRLALTIGYKPTRKQLYKDRDLIREQPFITSLYAVFMAAVPRPVTPYYMMISQIMQPEFSAAVSGIKKPEDALRSAHEQIEYILQVEK